MKPIQPNLPFRFLSSKALACSLLVGATLLIYAKALFSPFIWDDHGLIVNNELIKSPGNLAPIFQRNVLGGSEESFYRPLQMLSYKFDARLWGLNPFGFHLSNILLHAATGIALFFLIDALFAQRAVSFLTALFFLIHPIQTESVVYISSRADLLVALFILLSCLCYERYLVRGKKRLLAGACVFVAAALLSKEYAVIAPALLVLIHLAHEKRSSWEGLIPVGLLAIVYAAGRFGDEVSGAVKTTLMDRLPGSFVALFEYARLLLWPQDLHMGYGLMVFTFADLRAWAGLVILGMLCLGAIYWRGRRTVFFACAWFLAALLPVANIYPMNAYMAEHWLYTASIGFYLGVSLMIVGISAPLKHMAGALVVVLAVIYGVLTAAQSLVWGEPVAFYQRIIRLNPSFVQAYNNLGAIYAEKGNWQEAELYFKKALAMKAANPEALSNLVRVTQEMGRDQEAMSLMQQTMDKSVFDSETLNNQGLAMYYDGTAQEAKELYRQAIEARATNKEALNNLANVLLEEGDLEEAKKYYEQALSLDPQYIEAMNNLGFLHFRLNDRPKAREYYEQALLLEPDYIEANNNLGLLLYEEGNEELAKVYLENVLSQDPNNLDAMNVLGVIYGKHGQYEKAEAMFVRILQIKPDYVSAIKNLSKAREMKTAGAAQ